MKKLLLKNVYSWVLMSVVQWNVSSVILVTDHYTTGHVYC